MKLYIVRHAVATERKIKGGRPLTAKGVAQTKAMARFLDPLEIEVGAVWHSGKRRAVQTAELLLPAIRSKKGLCAREGLNPFDNEKDVARELESADVDLMIVGHEPFLGRLIARLVGQKPSRGSVELAKGAVACLEHTANEWKLLWLITPALVPAGNT